MEEFALKFLLGSNLKEHLGETEVMREAEMSGEKCGMTAELSQPAGLAAQACDEGPPGRGCLVGSEPGGVEASAATPRLLTPGPPDGSRAGRMRR